ncbi:MAG: aminotransferase class III-fold pyridoxal phosphate-dependent enzyme, partial [Actinobacteria bacterium]|nr:aminotransferase class III-fold pyridoxal phosphate-dependent enzyme [Actinomycetota bacterium]
VGRYFKSQLEKLRTDDPRIVDVRGLGLYLGIEFAEPDTLEPMSWLARAVSERMLQRGVVVYPNGVLGNCLKLKPPMVFGPSDVDRFIATLRATLEEIR